MQVVEDPRGLAFDVLVTPRAARERIGPVVGERLKVAVCAPPVDGEANTAVCACLAKALGVARSAVTIVHGDSGRRKRVHVAGVARAQLERLLGP
jgi:uncharacterized protein (TIGR00251 family)